MLSRGAAARASRSLIASPSPSCGTGSTAIVFRTGPVQLLQEGEEIGRSLARVPGSGQVAKGDCPAGVLRPLRAEAEQGLAAAHLACIQP